MCGGTSEKRQTVLRAAQISLSVNELSARFFQRPAVDNSIEINAELLCGLFKR
jgi:hypothetical protein